MAFMRPSRKHINESALRALYYVYAWGHHLWGNSQHHIPGGYILGWFPRPQLQVLLPLVPTEDSGPSLHPSGMMWLTERPGPSLHTTPRWPPHTGLVTCPSQHWRMTFTVEFKCEAQCRCRGSVCGGGSLSCPLLFVPPRAQSSCTPDSLQPPWAKVSVSSLRPLVRVSDSQRSWDPSASTLPDLEGSA